MHKLTRLFTIALPLLVFLILVFFFWLGLHHDPHHLPSALLNKSVPKFTAVTLNHKTFSDTEFKNRVTLLNVWSSDCYPCTTEHKILMQIKQAQIPNLSIVGINYQDNPKQAIRMLKKMGNPYRSVIQDSNGQIAMNFGVFGTPETFIIDQHGVIRYRHAGALTSAIWEKELLPMIKREVHS